MATSSEKAIIVSHPLINSIPPELAARFDPAYLEYYNKYSAGRLATHQIPIESYRADPAKYTTVYGRQRIDQGNLIITEQQCPVEGGSITIRIFQPEAAEKAPGPRPVYINFHGGGWVFGGLATDFDLCKRLALETGCVCFDVDYRLAPEYKFPIPLDDCWAGFQWVRDHKDEFNIDVNRIAIGGASAGGHLSAVVAHFCRDAGIPLAFQVLAVPVCDLHVFTPEGALRPDQPYESYREMYYTQPLPAERMAYFHNKFLGDPRPASLDDDWKVSPIKAPNFKDLAPAIVITAEMDPLRDEGEAYGKKMNEAGSKAEIIRVPGVPHVFMQMDDFLEGGKLFNKLVIKALNEAFATK
ncbi:hypothetical protein BP6252_08311 [Coleophoma cylindrospora]|uniref:Alpha/beta hydrolase fold-3 domain-containing protein n=1 Tax=Coleophoma cylindrospora TaxID=1849047 RepID=A0A3D8R5S8_9HELO|nr:hypothetical protein BP6252_08311 [Coleophoma cylindrospora]